MINADIYCEKKHKIQIYLQFIRFTSIQITMIQLVKFTYLLKMRENILLG